MNTFSERLKLAIQGKGISQAELSRLTGISKSSLTDYLKGKYEAKQDKVYLLSKVLNVNEAWLLGFDNVPMIRLPDEWRNIDFPEDNSLPKYIDKTVRIMYELHEESQKAVLFRAQELQQEQEQVNSKLLQFPVQDVVRQYNEDNEEEEIGLNLELSAGYGIENYDKEHYIDYIRLNRKDIPLRYDLVARIKGDSMAPYFHNGQIVFLQNTPDISNGMIAAVEINGEAFLKELYIEEGRLCLVSLNNEIDENGALLYPDFYANGDDEIYIIGKVVS